MKDNEAIKVFWDAVPDDTTWEDLAEGIDITLPNGKTFNTRHPAGSRYRIHSMSTYQENLERQAIALLKE